MANVHIDSQLSDSERRARIYQGDIFIISPTQSSLALCQLADSLLQEAFSPHDPEFAQAHFSVEEYAKILADVKPRFIHHPDCKKLIPEILAHAGCDTSKSYFDVPRLRTSTAQKFLTTGIAYAFHPHRDTWYSAAPCQINCWMPVRPMSPDNGMAFYPRYFANPVKNGSSNYDYYRWNQESRKDAAKHIGEDTREQPRPEEELELQPDLRLAPPVGGLILFSAAQLHASVDNLTDRTRLSVDFRIVNENDVRGMRGAINIDSRCTGTSLRDFLRCGDLKQLSPALIEPYDSVEPPSEAITVYKPDA